MKVYTKGRLICKKNRGPVTQLSVGMVSSPLESGCSVSWGQFGEDCWSEYAKISCMESVTNCLWCYTHSCCCLKICI
jgi:hypothetical protein